MSTEQEHYEIAVEREDDRTTNKSGEAASCCCRTLSIDKLDILHLASEVRFVPGRERAVVVPALSHILCVPEPVVNGHDDAA